MLKNTIIAFLAGFAVAIPHLSPRADPPLTNATITVKDLGQVTINKPAFATVIPQDRQKNLYLSTFQLLGGDSVQRIDDIAGVVSSGSFANAKANQIPGSITWPNDVSPVPAELFGTEGVIAGGGFLVPGKGNGGLWFSPSTDGANGDWVRLAGASGFFYHRAIFADIDMDGNLEIVSCRAKKPIVGSTQTMLVYLKPTDPAKPVGAWTEFEIGAGCDSLFQVDDLDGDGIPEVIAPSFFTSEFSIFKSTSQTAGFADKASVRKILVDKTIGAAFDVEYVDINNDGKKELLVTNHQGGNANPKPSVYAYEIPADLTDVAGYVRHTLADGFPVTQGGLNQASPGTAVSFYPTEASKSGFPYIALAGDAAQIAYVLIPGTEPWAYTTTTLINCKCTVGALAAEDVDGDGNVEIFVPCYDNNRVAAFSFA